MWLLEELTSAVTCRWERGLLTLSTVRPLWCILHGTLLLSPGSALSLPRVRYPHNPTNTEYMVLPNEEAPKLSLLFLTVTSPHWRWKRQAFCLPGASRWPQGNIYCLALHQRLLQGWSFLKWDMPASSTSPKLLTKHPWFHSRNGDYRSIAVTQSWEASQLLSSPTPLPVPPCLRCLMMSWSITLCIRGWHRGSDGG